MNTTPTPELHLRTWPRGDDATDHPLTDPLVQAFERTTLDPAAFHHREHLYVAWCYLRALPLEDALARYVDRLRRLTVALGVPHKFHATMTWAYMVLLGEAMGRSPNVSFDELLARHPTLLDRNAALAPYYDRAVLDSDEARRSFVLPRRG
jgi:hypothetical protein